MNRKNFSGTESQNKGTLDYSENSWRNFGSLDLALLEYFPDFLIVSPPRTGSTWLSNNLSCHPEVFIPKSKELRFFCTYWKWLDINWYLKQFQNYAHLKKGEASPSYAILPSETIKLIKLLKPNLKLIFLMRDPAKRAWSQAKHDYKSGAISFRSCNYQFDDIPDEILISHFIHELSHSFGDYKGCLIRWLRFFPKEQFYLGFYETIKDNPRQLLIEIFQFLGLSKNVDWSQFHVSERINPSLERETSPKLNSYLRSLYSGEAKELSKFLQEQFYLDVPPEWEENNLWANTTSLLFIEEEYKGYNIFLCNNKFYAFPSKIDPASISYDILNENPRSNQIIVGSSYYQLKYIIDQLLQQKPTDISPKKFDENHLMELFSTEIINLYPLLVEEDYKNFNIILYKGKFIALSQNLGHVTKYDEDTLREYQDNNQCFIANSRDAVKELINQLNPELVEENYWNFNLVHYKGKFFALALTLGPVDLIHLEEERLTEFQMTNQCFISNSLKEVKDQVNQLVDHSYRQKLAEKDEQILSLRQELSNIKSKHTCEIMSYIKKFTK